jgi:2,4-dienoyl-CoA reductase-like NADH-dependent reductase (Old Yellow Enzyme family)
VSTGGFDGARFDIGPGMFLASAARIRREAGVPVMAVGLMGDADLADRAIADGDCDLVALGRAALDDPNWPMHALRALGRETRDAWTRQAGYAIERWPMKPAPRKAVHS